MKEIGLGQHLIYSPNVKENSGTNKSNSSSLNSAHNASNSQLSSLIKTAKSAEVNINHLNRIDELKSKIESNEYRLDMDQLIEQLFIHYMEG